MERMEIPSAASSVPAVIADSASPEEKLEALKKYIRDLGSLAVGFSGGVDSTFLLKTAREVLGDHVLAITAKSNSFPGRELSEAEEFCRAEGIRHEVLETNELAIEGFWQNPANRCYICKKELFSSMKAVVEENGISSIAEGSNLDDNGDYRPGLVAIAELGVLSPLRACRLTKREIRILSKQMGLPTWKKSAFACLATRFPYGEEITAEKLQRIEKAEDLLLRLGFEQFRVRSHGDLARIEVLPEEIDRIMQKEMREEIDAALRSYGFAYVSLDMRGYRMGSMNETLK